MAEIIAIARRVAAAVPDARLGCPVCGVALGAANLERHLAKVHPGQDDAGTSWRGRGWKGGSLTWDDGVLHWRSRTGLRRRSVERTRAVVAGTTLSTRTEHTSMTTHPDHGGASYTERSGAYLLVRGDGRPITVRCRSGATVRKTWVGWQAGPAVKRWQVTVDADAFVALTYLLADAGVLRPKVG